MGMLIEGQWHDAAPARVSETGAFQRTPSTFRDWIGADSERFAPESGRYHLFVNPGCPWAWRTILYRQIKHLDKVISMSMTQAAAGPEGWTFGAPEALQSAKHIHELYTRADSQFTGRATVPVLWDTRHNTIVNNESAEIIRMLNGAFDHLDGVSNHDYYPAEHRADIDALNASIYDDINNGVYRCGFATTQDAYDMAFDRLFAALDELEQRLSRQRFLCGAVITEADWRLFATLVRFDVAYYSQFRCNRNRLTDFEHLWPYTRDLYQQPGVAEVVDVQAIKGIYYGSRSPGILPRGPEIDFEAPHTRDRL